MPHRAIATVVSILAIFALEGCGGGGSSAPPPPISIPTPTPSSPPPMASQPPVFSSGTTVTVAENLAAGTTIYQAAASDPEGAPVNYAISGGVDQAQFAMTSSGALRFVGSPDFDLPRDADQDNLYEVQIAASDGAMDSRQTVRVSVTNDREGLGLGQYCGLKGCQGASQQVGMIPTDPVGGVPTILVAEKSGILTKVLALDDFGGSRAIPGVANDGERGIISITRAPDHASSGEFYVMYTATSGDIVVQRFPRNFVDTGAVGPVVLRIPHGQFNNNLGGWIGFAADGSLYVATGDGGGSGDPLNTAQDSNSWLGKLLRLNPDFSTITVVAKGFRNPNGGFFHNGNLILADRGESQREELNIIPLSGPVRNYGWPFREGTLTVRQGGPADLVDPLAECPHVGGSRGCHAIVGGAIYNGNAATLQGQYIFADRDFVNPATGTSRSGLYFTIPVSSLVFGQPTIQVSEFSNRTFDLLGGFPGISDPTSFTLVGRTLFITQFKSAFVSFLN